MATPPAPQAGRNRRHTIHSENLTGWARNIRNRKTKKGDRNQNGKEIHLRRQGIRGPRPGDDSGTGKTSLADFYGELANATVSETKRGDDTIYQFNKRVGTKGATGDGEWTTPH